jgi:hypothetical protein
MSDSGRCRDCRWWEVRPQDRAFLAERYDEPEAGICRRAEQKDFGLFMYGYVSDAEIATRPDFGCVRFEAKR